MFNRLFKKPDDPASAALEPLVNVVPQPAALVHSDAGLACANAKWIERFGKGPLDRALRSSLGAEDTFKLCRAIASGGPAEAVHPEGALSVEPCGPFSLAILVPPVALQTVASPSTSDNTTPRPVSPAAGVLPQALAVKPSADCSKCETVSVNTLPAERRAAIIDGAPLGIATLDSKDVTTARVLTANQAFIDMCCGTVGGDFANLILEGDRAALRTIATGMSEGVELELASIPGRVIECWLSVDGSDGATLIINDVTRRRNLEASLGHSSNLEVIGTLAADMAHDLNNTFAVINLHVERLLVRHTVGDPSYPDLQEIFTSVGRSAATVRQLLNYARQQTVRRTLMDVSEALSDFRVFIARLVDRHAELEVKHGRGLPPLLLDPQQFEQMLMNLATNARDAIKDRDAGRGTLAIQTAQASSDEVRSAMSASGARNLPQCDWVKVTVSDTGAGMPEEIKQQIFEPFFTTKAKGEGTGIGMASIYGIVKRANGYITVDSKLGEGTTFSIFFPEAASQTTPDELADLMEQRRQARVAPPEQDGPPPATDLTGNGRMLFVEDEPGLRRMVAEQFRELGYDVTVAEDGEEGLEILEDQPGAFEFILSDVRMPGMDGTEMLKEAKPYLGSAKVVLMTGYAEADLGHMLEADREFALVPKPYQFTQLAEQVKLMGAA